jgi:HEAT repeat protein
MNFDAENFGLGILIGWGTAYLVYRARDQIQSAWQSVGSRATSASTSARRGADSRYVGDLIDQCETTHLAGKFVKLSDIIIEPRFLPAPEFTAPPDNDVVKSVYRVIPHLPDHPYLQAPYNVETLTISELATGSRALALLGLPGSGRTTALLAMALYSLGAVKFNPPPDKVQARLDAEEAKLEEKERAVRIQERITMEARAKERLATEIGIAFSADNEDLKNQLPLFNRLMPVYVHMADLNATAHEFGPEADPAEHLVRAVQHTVRRVTASTIPRNLYSRLNRGQILLLLDGYDDLPESEQPAALAWLKAYLEQYDDNFVIVVGPARGYGSLLRVGLTPIFMRPWSDEDVKRSAELWSQAWATMKKRKGDPPDRKTIQQALKETRALSPLEITLKIWGTYAGDTKSDDIAGWWRAYLARHLDDGEESIPQIARIAALQLDEGFVTSARLQELMGAVNPAERQAKAKEKAKEKETSEEDLRASVSKQKSKQDSETTSAQGRQLGALRRSGLLMRFRGDRYLFSHAMTTAFLGSLSIRAAKDEQLAAKANLPAWRDAIAYSAATRELDLLVTDRMRQDPDILMDNIVEMARWISFAPPNAEWRGRLLTILANQMIAPSQYPLVRERLAAAMIDTRDKDILLIFRKAARNADVDIRRLACLGMGTVGDEEAVRDLGSLLNDQDASVQLAAALALGAIGTDDALQEMVVALTSAPEQVRQAMAEAFAAIPDEGYPTLFDAVSEEDMLVRRAAIFGLRRLRTTWALVAIYRAFLDDDQWYVRSAAQQAFQELTFGRTVSLTTPYPQPEDIPWLKNWAQRKGEKVTMADGGRKLLLAALQEGEAPHRILAASNLGQLGMVEAVRALYNALRDGREEVRATAHRALAEFQLQMDEPLPSPL